MTQPVRWAAIALATLLTCAAGCARVSRAEAPHDRIVLSMVPSGHTLLAVGDTLQLRAQLVEFHEDAGFVRPGPPRGEYRWQSSDADVASIGAADGTLVARAVGDVTVELEGEGREAANTYSVIPSVASIRWEPSQLELRVGAGAVVRAVALDSSGRVVALLPLASVGGMSGALATATQSERSGWIRVRGGQPGTTWLTANLGTREARLRVTIRQ